MKGLNPSYQGDIPESISKPVSNSNTDIQKIEGMQDTIYTHLSTIEKKIYELSCFLYGESEIKEKNEEEDKDLGSSGRLPKLVEWEHKILIRLERIMSKFDMLLESIRGS